MRASRNRRGTSWMPVVAAIVGSSMVHLVCWPVGNKVLEYTGAPGPLPKADGVMQVSLMPSEPEAPEADALLPEPEPPTPPEKLVNLDRVDDERPPPESDFVSEFDSTVPKQTRAPKQRPKPGDRNPAGDRPNANDRKHQPSKGEKPGRDPAKSGVALPLGGRDAAAGESRGVTPDPSERPTRDPGGDVPSPSSLSPRAVAGFPSKARKEWGASGTHDDLNDVEEGGSTQLNARRWKYASFFNRVRNSIAERWDPASLHAARDPDGRINGTKTRVTRLFIKLNPDGSISKIRPVKKSGVEYLDAEAIRAVRAAAPFTNPPAQLISAESGLIEFEFGFIFEINGTRRIHRYRR